MFTILFGISTPTAAFPGIGASILTPKAAKFSAISSAKLVILLIFGGRKIPELMKGIGKGVRSFKEGVNGIEKDIEEAGNEKK